MQLGHPPADRRRLLVVAGEQFEDDERAVGEEAVRIARRQAAALLEPAARLVEVAQVDLGDAAQVPGQRQARVDRQRALVQRQRLVEPAVQERPHMAGDGQAARIVRVEHDRMLGRLARPRDAGPAGRAPSPGRPGTRSIKRASYRPGCTRARARSPGCSSSPASMNERRSSRWIARSRAGSARRRRRCARRRASCARRRSAGISGSSPAATSAATSCWTREQVVVLVIELRRPAHHPVRPRRPA